MSIRPLRLASALVLVAFASAFAIDSARATMAFEDKSMKLTGCLVRGEGDGAGYLLINTPFEPSLLSSRESRVTPGSIGTVGNFANIFYWLDGDRNLQRHIGHRVEIEGHAKGDVKDGNMKIARKDSWTEMTVKADGRTMKARVPNASIVGSGHDDHDLKVLVRKIDVGQVRMLGANCQ
jgi:hypothetical protein